MKNVNIMLVCAAGMSTSLLVKKMKDYASSKGMEVTIFAIATPAINENINNKDIDVVLLGPQVKYLEEEIKEKLSIKSIPLGVINTTDYGMMKGDKVLEFAMELIKK